MINNVLGPIIGHIVMALIVISKFYFSSTFSPDKYFSKCVPAKFSPKIVTQSFRSTRQFAFEDFVKLFLKV